MEEALCFGWIDSHPRKLDAERTQLLFTPRKPRSGWSKVNKERLERLEKAGLIEPAGRAAIARAKENGAWESLDDAEAGAKMAAGDRNRINGLGAEFGRQLHERALRQATEILGRGDGVEKGRFGLAGHL